MSGLLGNIPWKRFWIPREEAPTLDGQGYLANPEDTYGKIANPHARTLEQLDDKPCVALLGEPGIGKSYGVATYSASMVAREDPQTVIPIDCRWDRDLKEDIFATDPFKRWLAGGSPLTLIIDSLDEHPQGAYEAASQLLGKLKRGPVASLRLRVACRTAEWPSILDEQLPHLWSMGGEEARAVFYTLAPLRQADVAQAAGGDAAAFLEQVAQRDVQPLAIKPITLGFLLEEYRRYGALPRTREDLYRNGCTILCEERSPTHEGSGRVGVLQPEQRLTITSRIAAVSILCRRSLIHRGVLRSSLSPDAVRLSDLVGGTEPSPLGEVEVTAEHLDEVLRVSGLFASRGAEYVGWAHQTYAEFLAACFLRARGLSVDEALRELSNPTMRRMVPALRETAAWLAGMDKGVFDRLLAVDPELLLRSDFAMVGAAEQEALTQMLLQQIDRRELHANAVLFRRDVQARLSHPRLADQLLPYIVEPDHYVMARLAAIDIAEHCRIDMLQGVLTERALDSGEVHEVRVAAARMVCHLGSRATKRRLKPLIFGDCGTNPDDSLKGYALEALWPHDLDAAELFANLDPAQDETHVGSYAGFLHRLEESLAPENLVEALRWTTKLPARHGTSLPYAFSSLLDAILSAGWDNIHNDDVRAALAEAVRQRLALHDGIFEHRSYRGDKNPDLTHDDIRRRLLAGALLDLPPWGKYDVFSYLDEKITLPRDVPWALRKIKTESSASQRARWAAVLNYVACRGWTFDIADPIIAALPEVEELQRAMPWAFPLHVQLGSPESRRMRREVRQIRKLNGKCRHKQQDNRRTKKRGSSAKRFIRRKRSPAGLAGVRVRGGGCPPACTRRQAA